MTTGRPLPLCTDSRPSALTLLGLEAVAETQVVAGGIAVGTGLRAVQGHGRAILVVDMCPRRSKFEPPCRLNIEPGVEADFERVGCG